MAKRNYILEFDPPIRNDEFKLVLARLNQIFPNLNLRWKDGQNLTEYYPNLTLIRLIIIEDNCLSVRRNGIDEYGYLYAHPYLGHYEHISNGWNFIIPDIDFFS